MEADTGIRSTAKQIMQFFILLLLLPRLRAIHIRILLNLSRLIFLVDSPSLYAPERNLFQKMHKTAQLKTLVEQLNY